MEATAETPDTDLARARERNTNLSSEGVRHEKEESKFAPQRSSTTLDDFLQEDGKRDEFEVVAIKEVLAWQIAEAMKINNISRNAWLNG